MAARAKTAQSSIYDHALSVGFSRDFKVCALVALLVAVAMIRVTRQDLAGIQPIPG